MPLFCFCLLFSVVYRFCHGTPLVYCYFICIYLQLHATITNYHSSTQLHQQTTVYKSNPHHAQKHTNTHTFTLQSLTLSYLEKNKNMKFINDAAKTVQIHTKCPTSWSHTEKQIY